MTSTVPSPILVAKHISPQSNDLSIADACRAYVGCGGEGLTTANRGRRVTRTMTSTTRPAAVIITIVAVISSASVRVPPPTPTHHLRYAQVKEVRVMQGYALVEFYSAEYVWGGGL